MQEITRLPDGRHETADEPERKKQVSHSNCTTSTVLAQCGRLASVLQKHKGTVSLYQRQLATALVLGLVSVGQTEDPKQAALSVLHQLLQIQHDSLAMDTDGQGSQCMGCGIAVHICAWKVSTTSRQLCAESTNT